MSDKTITVSEETYNKIKDQLLVSEQKEIANMDDLIGETYCFQCARYIYHGEVEKVNSDFITLKNAGVVFDTGAYDANKCPDKQDLPNGCKVMRASIESFYKLKW